MQARRLFADQYEGNPEPNLTAYATAGHVLYAHKASEGAAHFDQRHKERVLHAHQQGLTVLHYHYCRPDQRNPEQEVELFWLVVGPTFQPGDILALDFERGLPGHGVVPDREYIEKVWQLVRTKSGHTCVVYGSTSFLNTFTSTSWLRFKRRWQAQYGRWPSLRPWLTHWWAWQDTDGKEGQEPFGLPGIGEGDVSILNARSALALSARTRQRRRRLKKQSRNAG